jgi:hypothetical protein
MPGHDVGRANLDNVVTTWTAVFLGRSHLLDNVPLAIGVLLGSTKAAQRNFRRLLFFSTTVSTGHGQGR